MTKIYHIGTRYLSVIILVAIFIEVASLIIIGNKIGIFATFSLIFLTTVGGCILLRAYSINLLSNMRRSFVPGYELKHNITDELFIIIGAIFLILPGFVSDILGLLLLIKPVRTFVCFLFLLQANKSSPHTKTKNEKTIDLSAEDYQNCSKKESPWYKD
ncbi:FxsA family protein [Bartonella ancashensis]|uniref:FxsA protein n=1 Tax=Bartonella ancashensis TaxID=1318743 RepID=A0A0M4LG65_9HYPH|nr:FxsA family protein [Bartonella ancashensis]ALE03357.1 FxsA protein [Bartonella ancashensis]